MEDAENEPRVLPTLSGAAGVLRLWASMKKTAWRSKVEQEKQRKEQAIANATGLRVLFAASAAVAVRAMNRDLLFVVDKLSHG